MSPVFDKILVCNRGEIAVRIIRAAKDLGIATVAAYSAADRGSRAVAIADEAVCVGPGPSAKSYLNVPALLYACAKTGAQAVHPGYGFLSENADFAAICADAGLTFIGPPASVIGLMGDKVSARGAMAAAGLPVPAGVERPIVDVDDARERAEAVGYPVMLKAAAGGGGRGMQVVHGPAGMPAALEEVQRVAAAVFLDDRVYLEKFVVDARHVEIQVLADYFGNVVHLGERDCSIQRRQQKLVEESPSTVVAPGLRARMGEAAVAGARAIGYVSAGTMEFLVDSEGEFHFMEMNTRIQVEHPVTEMLTGVDLVTWMLRIARGEQLTLTQADVVGRGHVIECRINAEDPARNWQGSLGTLERFVPPGGPRVRVDTHAFPGYTVPPFYDSLLAKIIVHGDDRAHALRLLDRALGEFECTGVQTTADFHRELLRHPVFVAGEHRLDFLSTYMDSGGVLHREEV